MHLFFCLFYDEIACPSRIPLDILLYSMTDEMTMKQTFILYLFGLQNAEMPLFQKIFWNQEISDKKKKTSGIIKQCL